MQLAAPDYSVLNCLALFLLPPNLNCYFNFIVYTLTELVNRNILGKKYSEQVYTFTHFTGYRRIVLSGMQVVMTQTSFETHTIPAQIFTQLPFDQNYIASFASPIHESMLKA